MDGATAVALITTVNKNGLMVFDGTAGQLAAAFTVTEPVTSVESVIVVLPVLAPEGFTVSV